MPSFSDVFGGIEVSGENAHPQESAKRLRLSSLAKGFMERSDNPKDYGQISLGKLSSATADKYHERTAVNQVRAAITGHERPDRMFVEQLKALVGGDSYEVTDEPLDAHSPTDSVDELRGDVLKYLESVGPMKALKLVLGWMEHELTESPQEEAMEHAMGANY